EHALPVTTPTAEVKSKRTTSETTSPPGVFPSDYPPRKPPSQGEAPSEHRNSVQLVAKWAARPLDLLQALNEHKPHVVHFSGHGSDKDELVFQADDGSTKLVSKEAIVTTMSTAADNIRVVMLNACFSQSQARAVTKHIDIAIGMNAAIGDEAARVFAAKFYSAVGFGRSVQQAFNQGRAALMLEGISGADTVEIFAKDGTDPNNIILVRPPT
ncbi:CHAT domain-containing protein, partial [Archangium sp.]|uniref:CHAT domain-containing protein n=1 Tax=Archangium sp. TaxID=1872627 RepID=UPI002D6B68F2